MASDIWRVINWVIIDLDRDLFPTKHQAII